MIAGIFPRSPSTLAATPLVFLAAAAGTGVVTAYLRLSGYRLWGDEAGGSGLHGCRLGIERQPEILKDRLAPVVNPPLEHLCDAALLNAVA
jgi:hypothetical protein